MEPLPPACESLWQTHTHPYAQAPCSHANAPTSQHTPPSPRDVGDPATDEHAAHAQCDAPLR
eukprot:5104031-Prymnesium_polylepis.1